MNKFMRGIYSQDVFMESDVGAELSNYLYSFVKSYLFQAAAAYNLGLKFFGLYPKLHWVHEVAYQLRRQSRKASACLNPAVHSCSLDEDFIGRVAALSREVSPRLVPQRLLERYLAHIQICWARKWKKGWVWKGWPSLCMYLCVDLYCLLYCFAVFVGMCTCMLIYAKT